MMVIFKSSISVDDEKKSHKYKPSCWQTNEGAFKNIHSTTNKIDKWYQRGKEQLFMETSWVVSCDVYHWIKVVLKHKLFEAFICTSLTVFFQHYIMLDNIIQRVISFILVFYRYQVLEIWSMSLSQAFQPYYPCTACFIFISCKTQKSYHIILHHFIFLSIWSF